MIIPTNELREIERLQGENLNLQAYEIAKKFGPLKDWEGTRAVLAASHLAYSLGAPDESYRLSMRAWHRDKNDPEAMFFYAIETLQRRGPLHALLFTRRYPDFQADDKITSWWFSLNGQLRSAVRDFAVAEKWHERAVEVGPAEPWVWVSKAYSLEQQDRYDEAMECALRGYELNDKRRATVSTAAHFLTLLQRDNEALAMLERTAEVVENAWIQKELADIQSELGMHEHARSSLDRCFDLLPLMEGKVAEWFYGNLSDTVYLLGETGLAIEYAVKASNPFHTRVGERLQKAASEAGRVVLDVGFLRQHHVTCAPATLSNVAAYWNKHADHLDVVEQICYDGTPSYKERSWAESNGWRTKEFTLNWKNATALIDLGVPLTLATVHPGGGHLQAIIGYDSKRGTYLLRDPYYRRTGEILAEELLEEQRSNGPRVMALVPADKAELIENIAKELFESDIYDLVFEIERSLEAHRREAAGVALTKLEQEHPGHRLTHVAQWTVAAYDSNNPKVLSAMRDLLAKYPDDVNLRLNDLSLSAPFTGREERLAKLEQYSTDKLSDPLIWQMFGYDLSSDAAQHNRALHWLYRSARRSPGNALTFKFIADILWSQRRFEEATELYRIASSMNDKDDQLAYSYFLAMRYLKRADEALEVLAGRVNRFGNRSGEPVKSLFAAYRELGRVTEGFAVLSDALTRRPEDGDLMLFAAEMRARYGNSEAAAELLASARDLAPGPQWMRSAAHIGQIKGELSKSLELWREVSAVDPAALDAHENIAFLLKGLEGEHAAQEHLRRVCRKFPTNRNLLTLRLQYLDDEPSEAIAVLRDLLRLDPQDIWGWRELSSWYVKLGRFDRALDAADKALEADPNDATSLRFRGHALEHLKRYPEAAAEYRKAIERDVDQVYAIRALMGLARTLDAKREALSLIREGLSKQNSDGDGLSVYREQSRGVLNRETVLAQLQEYAAANAESYHAISAVTQQLADMGRTKEALTVARSATEKFPLVHQLWSDLAVIHKMDGDIDAELEALQMAVSVNPSWSFGVQQYAESLQRAGRFDEARDLLSSALTRMPFDNFLLGYLADAYWHLGEKDKAFDAAKRAVTLDPDYRWAWSAIKRWAENEGDRELPVELARELTRKKPKDVRAWITLAEMLAAGVYSDERMDAVEQALRLDPGSAAALSLKAAALADARRFDEAIEVTRTRAPDGHRPEQLRYAEAQIEMMRGRTSNCVNVLVELTESSPGYLLGWNQLADIYRVDPNTTHEYRKAALELVRLAPQEAIAYGYLGEACLKLDLAQEARDAFQQAVILDPAYAYAANELFDLLVDNQDAEGGTAKIVDSIASASPGTGLPLQIRLRLRAGEQHEAVKLLRKLLLVADVNRDQLDPVVNEVNNAIGRKDRSLVGMLEEVTGVPGVNPLAGRYLVDVAWLSESRKASAARLDSLHENGSLWAEAATRFLELLAEKNMRDVMKFIDANAEKLKAWTVSFGAVTAHLCNFNDLDRMNSWFEGWGKRNDVAAWMLWNRAILQWRNGFPTEAEAVHRSALEVPYDETVNLHLTLLGLSEFGRRNFAASSANYSGINPSSLSGWDRYIFDMLSEAIWANETIDNTDTEGAMAIVDSMVSQIISVDPKRADRITRDLLIPAVHLLLERIGNRWFSLKVKAKFWYRQIL